MNVTMRIKRYSANDLAGFINIITENGYSVVLRKGNNAAMTVDITNDSAVVRAALEDGEWLESQQ